MKNKRRRGFSLVELMVVVTILGILAAIAIVNLAPQADKARQKSAAAQIAAFQTSLQLYHNAYGKFPDSLQSLSQADPKNNNQPWMKSIPTDPWNNQYKYEKTGSSYRITCYGADAVRGGADANADITSDTLDKFK